MTRHHCKHVFVWRDLAGEQLAELVITLACSKCGVTAEERYLYVGTFVGDWMVDR